jgi:hypothetical protein
MRNIFIDEHLLLERIHKQQRGAERRFPIQHMPAPGYRFLARLMNRLGASLVTLGTRMQQPAQESALLPETSRVDSPAKRGQPVMPPRLMEQACPLEREIDARWPTLCGAQEYSKN